MSKQARMTEEEAIKIITENSACVLSEEAEVKRWIHAINMATGALRRQATMKAIAQEGGANGNGKV